MIKLTLCIMLLSYFFGSCINPGLNYPYAENNTATDSLFGKVIKDDYKWLEINVAKNEQRNQWLAAQKKLTNDYFGVKDQNILKRISELSEMPNYIPIEVRDSTIYYFKVNIYSNKAQLFAFNQKTGQDQFLADLGYSMRALARLKTAISPDEKKIAVINAFNAFQNDILIYNLEEDTQAPIVLSRIKGHNPIWYGNKLIYTEDGFMTNSHGNRICFFDIEKRESSLIYEDELTNLFDPIDVALDPDKDILYASNYKDSSTYHTVAIDLKSKKIINEIFNISANNSLDYRMAGTDGKHLFYVIYDGNYRSKLFSYNMTTNKLHLLEYDPNRVFTHFYQIKDHVIASYNNMNGNKAVLINLNDSSKKEINISKTGIPTFFNNKKSHDIIYIEEAFHKSQVLMTSSAVNPEKVKVLVSSKYMPFDYNLFESKHIVLDSVDGDPINLQISHRKGLKMDGSNPTILCSYPNLGMTEINCFYFSRILFMEQGVVFVQRSAEDYKKHYTLEEKKNDVKRIVEYLVSNNYTSKEKLCLSGFEYGSTIFANLLNEEPDICRVALLSNGIFDMLNHAKKDKLKNHSQRFFDYYSKEEFINVLAEWMMVL